MAMRDSRSIMFIPGYIKNNHKTIHGGTGKHTKTSHLPKSFPRVPPIIHARFVFPNPLFQPACLLGPESQDESGQQLSIHFAVFLKQPPLPPCTLWPSRRPTATQQPTDGGTELPDGRSRASVPNNAQSDLAELLGPQKKKKRRLAVNGFSDQVKRF